MNNIRLFKYGLILLVFVVSVLIIGSTCLTTYYNILNHKWLYVYGLQSLPDKTSVTTQYDRRMVGQNWSYDNKLVDLFENFSQIASHDRGHHEILFYNKPDVYLLDLMNSKIREKCHLKNCHFTDDKTMLADSSAVVFSISHHGMGTTPPPKARDQVWIFTDREPPIINNKNEHRHRNWNNVMNWSMTYRLDSDIFSGFGYLRTRRSEEIKTKDYSAIFRSKTKFAAWAVSNCQNMEMSARSQFAKELQKLIPLDIFGKCGTMELDRKHPEATLKHYKFYLAFENSLCHDYVTEKFFDNYDSDLLLVVRGGADYGHFFPAKTYINTADYKSVEELAGFLKFLNSSEKVYTDYMRRKDKYTFERVNWECNLCAKLNNKNKYRRTYTDLVGYLHSSQCWSARDLPKVMSNISKVTVVILLIIICTAAYVVFKRRIVYNTPR